ncbi:hypothetical protein H6F67_08625 [Microcoleus sp. FACHB-1515]|uniref:hypothetical protein n=1 Tax=Cyanophyceae TaxID=3028117 RepID=UPI0016874FA1|nr:hypothetical protein [Microcoleus sp. FACHB-1515]MBD2089918.1 hypothetical protein [Microcoleus sp. FACHB-1515]
MRQVRWRRISKFLLAAIALALMFAIPMRQARSTCDPSYPTICIAPPPPDLDCADIAYRNFPVLPPDPHNFDGGPNRRPDGVGCELPP